MRWPFACCGLGDVWPLFISPPITMSLCTAINGLLVGSCFKLPARSPVPGQAPVSWGEGLLFSGAWERHSC